MVEEYEHQQYCTCAKYGAIGGDCEKHPFTLDKVRDPVFHGAVSENVWYLTELDKYNEQPYMYFVASNHYNALIDTGCGTGDIRDFIGMRFGEQVDSRELIVFNTSNQFEHSGGNKFFCTENGKLANGCRDLVASSASQPYTRSMEQTMAWMVGYKQPAYTPTRWLQDGEKVQLGLNPSNTLMAIHTPGLTPDHMCLWYAPDNRLFVGDLLCRWTPIMAISEYKSLLSYERSVNKILTFIKAQPEPDRIRLSCGHGESNLHWYPVLETLHNLVQNVNRKRATGRPVTGKIEGTLYESRDYSIRLLVGNVPSFIKDTLLEREIAPSEHSMSPSHSVAAQLPDRTPSRTPSAVVPVLKVTAPLSPHSLPRSSSRSVVSTTSSAPPQPEPLVELAAIRHRSSSRCSMRHDVHTRKAIGQYAEGISSSNGSASVLSAFQSIDIRLSDTESTKSSKSKKSGKKKENK